MKIIVILIILITHHLSFISHNINIIKILIRPYKTQFINISLYVLYSLFIMIKQWKIFLSIY